LDIVDAAYPDVESERLEGFWGSGLAHAALTLASEVRVNGKTLDSKSHDILVGAVARRRYTVRNGYSASWLCKEPSKLHPQGQARDDDFPTPQAIEGMISSELRRLVGPSQKLGTSGLMQFLFQSMQNAFDEESVLNRFPPPASRRGVYGATLSSFDLVGQGATRFQSMPIPLRNWLRVTKQNSASRMFTFTCTDLGRGIHGSMRDSGKWPEKSDLALISEAFKDEVTTKAGSSGRDVGFGLGKLYASAHLLRAILFIQSGGVRVYKTFSDDAGKTSEAFEFVPWPELVATETFGTSIGMAWCTS
jgi:hypothetical protein